MKVDQTSVTTAVIVEKENSDSLTLAWENISFRVTDKATKEEKMIINGMSGILQPGSICAVMGASGAGKSTFLDLIAGRIHTGHTGGKVYVNGSAGVEMKHVAKYCTQDDALFGNLTVRETLEYAAKFNLSKNIGGTERNQIINDLLIEFGLKEVENTIIGTPLLKGCSGGQVRRVSLASQIIGNKGGLLFLDEPTSGLDSVAAYAVVDIVKNLAIRKNATILTTIHQPSSETFNLFTHVLIVAQGRTVFFGKREDCVSHFSQIGHPVPQHSNPSDYYLSKTNLDFMKDKSTGVKEVNELVSSFENSLYAEMIAKEIQDSKDAKSIIAPKTFVNGWAYQTSVLLHRGLRNAIKNPLSYWIRVAMYTALALMMGSTWLRLGFEQANVLYRFISIYFAVAFLAFMSVAGIPAFLEERLVFLRERDNGLYGIESYLLSNFLVSMPFLAIISLSFSLGAYFLTGYQESASNFFVFVGFFFVMLMIAEAQVMFISVVIPIFVAALTIAAFANGMWMTVQGFALIKTSDIPPGWRYTFHYIDFQKYTFEALLKNEMAGLTFSCAKAVGLPNNCSCMVPSSRPAASCTFTGEDVLKYFEKDNVNYGAYLGILFAILVVFKLATYVVMKLQVKK